MGTVTTDNPVQQVQQMQHVQHPAAQIPYKHRLSAAARVATTDRFWPYAGNTTYSPLEQSKNPGQNKDMARTRPIRLWP